MGEVTTKAAEVDWGKVSDAIYNILSILAGAVKNPWLAAIASVMAVGATYWIIWYIKRHLRKIEEEAAKKETERGHQEQIEIRIPENRDNNERDNRNRSKLDDMN